VVKAETPIADIALDPLSVQDGMSLEKLLALFVVPRIYARLVVEIWAWTGFGQAFSQSINDFLEYLPRARIGLGDVLQVQGRKVLRDPLEIRRVFVRRPMSVAKSGKLDFVIGLVIKNEKAECLRAGDVEVCSAFIVVTSSTDAFAFLFTNGARLVVQIQE